MNTDWLSTYGQSRTGGTVYGTALNYRGVLAALGESIHAAPYGAPPRAPILYIKPRNTWIAGGAPISLPMGHEAVAAGPTLGILIGSTARRVTVDSALSHVGGYLIVNDLALPHTSYFRPAIAQQCRDGFCALGPIVFQVPSSADKLNPARLNNLAMRVWVDGVLRLTASTATMIRSVPQLIADVSEFMTLHTGDLLLTGLPDHLPLVRAGERVAIEIDGLGRLENPVVAPVVAPDVDQGVA